MFERHGTDRYYGGEQMLGGGSFQISPLFQILTRTVGLGGIQTQSLTEVYGEFRTGKVLFTSSEFQSNGDRHITHQISPDSIMSYDVYHRSTSSRSRWRSWESRLHRYRR